MNNLAGITLENVRLHRFDDNSIPKEAAYWDVNTLEEIDETLIPEYSFVYEGQNPEWVPESTRSFVEDFNKKHYSI